nr:MULTISPECIES: hypothetical protein [Thalassospira]
MRADIFAMSASLDFPDIFILESFLTQKVYELAPYAFAPATPLSDHVADFRTCALIGVPDIKNFSGTNMRSVQKGEIDNAGFV